MHPPGARCPRPPMQPILLDPGSNETLGVYAAAKRLAEEGAYLIEDGTYYQIKTTLIWRIYSLDR